MELTGNFVLYEPPFEPVTDDDPAVVSPALELAGIPVVEHHRGCFRCGQCNEMKEHGSSMAYIEDSIRIGDSWKTVIERSRRGNRHSTGWCLPCANKLLPPQSADSALRALRPLFGVK